VTGILLLGAIMSYAEEPMIVAHRGASRKAPENTIPAFNLAWEQGADAIEGDFRLTKDGHIVCIHDESTKDMSDRDLVITNSTLSDLRKLDLGARHGKEYKGTVIPTIAEVFSTIPEKKMIYIEVKCSESIVPKLLEEIEKSGLTREQIVVISFDPKVIHTLKIKAPQYKALWLSGFKKDESGKVTPSLETVLDVLRQTRADGFSSHKNNITEPFIRSLMKHGYEYHVWTVDDLKTARRFVKWGAKSITTNVPAHIKNHLAEQGH
jgi:glycerophosphoryl diester phosphodiesterase